MATVSEQLRAKKPAPGKPAQAKAGTAKPSAGKPAGKAAQAKPATETPKAEAPKAATPTELDITGETTLNAEQRATLSESELATYKENRKKAAFAKLKARAQEKKAKNVVARAEQMTAIQGELEVGQHIFMTRASYYGCEAVIEGFEEVRGRNLVVVRVVSTKKGRALDEDKTYIRKISPKFVTEERPTAAYVKRRGSATDSEDEAGSEVDDMTTAEDEVTEDEAGTEEEEAGTESEDEEVDSEDEESEDEDTEDSDEEDEEEDDEDSWGDEE